jgi:translocator protein
MKKCTLNQGLVVICTVILLAIYGLANLFQFNGMLTFRITEQLRVFFVPAGYVFWVLVPINLGLAAYAIYQALPANRENQVFHRISGWYCTASLAQSVLIVACHFQLRFVTTLVDVVLLISTIAIYQILAVGINKDDLKSRFLVKLPFSLYLGWITISTITIFSQALYLNRWSGFGFDARIWAVTMMVVTVVIAELVAFNQRDRAFLAVLIWAFIGIAVKHFGFSPIYEAAIASAIIVFIMLVLTILIRPREVD